jgi:hypothetical protein
VYVSFSRPASRKVHIRPSSPFADLPSPQRAIKAALGKRCSQPRLHRSTTPLVLLKAAIYSEAMALDSGPGRRTHEDGCSGGNSAALDKSYSSHEKFFPRPNCETSLWPLLSEPRSFATICSESLFLSSHRALPSPDCHSHVLFSRSSFRFARLQVSSRCRCLAFVNSW